MNQQKMDDQQKPIEPLKADELIPELAAQLHLNEPHEEEKKDQPSYHDSSITAEQGTKEWGQQIENKFAKDSEKGSEISELPFPSYEEVNENIE